MVPLEPIGRFESIDWKQRTGSTNADLVAAVRSGRHEPRVLLAEEQTAGRGRRDRTWEMPAGAGVLISFFVPWPRTPELHLVPMALGVASHTAIGRVGRNVVLKWPNDILAGDGRKVAGMLGEVVTSADGSVGAVVGLGCNVSWPTAAGELPGAAGLDELGEEPVDRRGLAMELISEFDLRLADLEQLGAEILLDRYRERCATLGQRVRVETVRGAIEGNALDVDGSGRLIVDVDGHVKTIDVGDVVHLRG